MAHCTFMWPVQVLKTSSSVMVRPPPKSTGVFDGVMPALRIAHDSSSVLGPRAIIARALAGRARGAGANAEDSATSASKPSKENRAIVVVCAGARESTKTMPRQVIEGVQRF